LCVNEQNAV